MSEKFDDLIKRAKKYGRSAGRTGLGHYRTATVNEQRHACLTAIGVILSAVVGTSIFAQWSQKYPTVLGIAAMSAAAVSAVQGSSKLAERAKEHRDAGADYGRIRRKVDLLRLRLEANDVTREKGLAELEEIADALSSLAKQSRALSDRQYNAAVKNFDRDHPEYYDISPNHWKPIIKQKSISDRLSAQ